MHEKLDRPVTHNEHLNSHTFVTLEPDGVKYLSGLNPHVSV